MFILFCQESLYHCKSEAYDKTVRYTLIRNKMVSICMMENFYPIIQASLT